MKKIKQLGISEARDNLKNTIAELQREGGEVIITRRGQVLARMVAIEQPRHLVCAKCPARTLCAGASPTECSAPVSVPARSRRRRLLLH